MTPLNFSPNIRPVLAFDAVLTGIAGLAVVGAASVVWEHLGLPLLFLEASGVILIGYAAIIGIAAGRGTPSQAITILAIIANLLWAAGCAAAMFWFADSLTMLGYVFLGAQIAFVLVFADLQYFGIRQSPAQAA